MIEMMNMTTMFVGYAFFVLFGILMIFMLITGSIFSISQYIFLCRVHKHRKLKWSFKKRIGFLIDTTWQFAGRFPCSDTGIKLGYKDGSYWKGLGNWYIKGVGKSPKFKDS
jgi:hypothetical protein